jgi:hypothetical protein
MTRPVCIGLNVAVPRKFINAVNIGLIDKVTDEAEAAEVQAKKKSSKVA